MTDVLDDSPRALAQAAARRGGWVGWPDYPSSRGMSDEDLEVGLSRGRSNPEPVIGRRHRRFAQACLRPTIGAAPSERAHRGFDSGSFPRQRLGRLPHPDRSGHAGAVTGEYSREHERRCRHRVHQRRACRQSRNPRARRSPARRRRPACCPALRGSRAASAADSPRCAPCIAVIRGKTPTSSDGRSVPGFRQNRARRP
jgi:hypothetical protein